MCGVFAMFLNRPLTDEDIAGARRALAAIAHRGPDGEGEWMDADAGVYLGHRRLAIIDLSTDSDQPLVREPHAFIFNGEIYNFRKLRAELQATGCRFVSQGDGEVFLAGWRAWGDRVLDRVDGMFAMALWDGARGTLAVDPLGEKPLFVAQTADGTYVCSEIAPLATLLGLEPELDVEGWAAYLSLGHLPPPATFFPGVEMMPPGSRREIRDGRVGPIRRYWRPPFGEPGAGRPEPFTERELDDVAGILLDSLRGRLTSDVPLTLFLSAGVDSALVAALCRKELNHDVHCLTVSFAGDAEMHDEAAAAARIAKALGFEHRVIENDTGDPDVSRLSALLGQPAGMVGILPFEQISKSARDAGFKVALTGMGGDEVTFGYAKHHFVWRLRHLFGAPAALRRATAAALSPLGRRGEAFSSLIAADPHEVYLAMKNYPALRWLRELPSFDYWARATFGGDDPAYVTIPRYELTTVMPSVHLLSSDHASMRHGLELRSPFLNRRLVEYLMQKDPRSLVAFGQKSLLRGVLDRYLPRELTGQRKVGFSYPRQRLLDRSVPRKANSLSDAHRRRLWDRSVEGGGWASIAVRLAVADKFLAAFSPAPEASTARLSRSPERSPER